MPIPDFQSIMLPFLDVLSDERERSMKEMVSLLAGRFSLSEVEQDEMLPSGNQKVFNNRVAWAKTHLKKAGLVDNPSRGRVRISMHGLEVLKEQPERVDVKFLRKSDDYRRFLGELKDEVETENSVNTETDEDQIPPLEQFETAHQKIRAALSEELLEKLYACSPKFFESIVVQLLRAMGYGGKFGEGHVTNYAKDGGIDGVINEDKLGLDVVCVQAKRWQGNVGRPTIQAFVGSMDLMKARKGVVITTSDYSKDAHEFVDRIEGKRVVLINGKRLAKLMMDHDVGVAIADTYELKEISNDFFEEDED